MLGLGPCVRVRFRAMQTTNIQFMIGLGLPENYELWQIDILVTINKY